MNEIYPSVSQIKNSGGTYTLGTSVCITYSEDALIFPAQRLSELLGILFGIKATAARGLQGEICLSLGALDGEAYELTVKEEGVALKAACVSGIMHAISSLIQLVDNQNGLTLPCVTVQDHPYSAIRGIHIYLPARRDIESFKRIIDIIAFFKMNTVFLEVGGGMQYDSHPEINESWERFCDMLDNHFPGVLRSASFQRSDVYHKDSVHTELGGGSYLTKAEVRDLVDYCKKQGMDVIPELQALSHAYYLTIAHPEIAEREEDPFPDTYCPMNDKSYELYFDVAREVIEVFEPKTVSIGHDEIRILGWCDQCRDLSGHELVARDINRLHDFYKQHGIRIAMWGESAQAFTTYTGGTVGGKDYEKTNHYGLPYHMKATYKCIDLIPNDILILDWYHHIGKDSEQCFMDRGFEIIYGNFYGSCFGEWEIRSKKAGIRGGEVSSWVHANIDTFAKQGVLFEIAYSAYLLWSNDYCNDKFNDVISGLLAAMPYARAIAAGETSGAFQGKTPRVLYRGEAEKEFSALDLASAEIDDPKMKSILGAFGDRLSGVSVDTGNILLRTEIYADSLLFVHNSKKPMQHIHLYWEPDMRQFGLSFYAVVYEDGKAEIIPIYYGVEIGAAAIRPERIRDIAQKSAEIDDDLSGEITGEPNPYLGIPHAWFGSLCYSTTPVFGKENSAFVYEWKNPHPDKKIIKIKAIHSGQQTKVRDLGRSAVLFGIAAL